MLDVLIETSQDEEDNSPVEDVEVASNEEIRNLEPPDGKRALKEGRARYYNRQQQLELVLAAQELSECGEHRVGDAKSSDEETSDVDTRSTDIWEDEICLGFLREGIIPGIIDPEESRRARKRTTNYC
jgi:hypothetical protein